MVSNIFPTKSTENKTFCDKGFGVLIGFSFEQSCATEE